MKIASIISDRKQIIKALAEITGSEVRYLGAPSFGYEIGPYTVDRAGAITAENMDPDVIAALVARGIIEEQGEETPATMISLPMEGHDGRSLRNLIYLLHSKGALIAKAVGKPGFYRVPDKLITELETKSPSSVEEFLQIVADAEEGSLQGLVFADDKISLQFLYTTEPDKLRAYMQLTELMGKMAREQVRVKPAKCKETNEKFTFRVWLMRLGMMGDEYKTTRKILLQNLKGHTAFRTKDQADVAKEKLRAQRAAEKEAAREMAFVEL